MGRAIPVLISLLVLVVAFGVPTASPERLAALQAYEMLELPVGTEPDAGAPDERPPLWKFALESAAGEKTEDGYRFRMGQVTAHPSPALRSAYAAGELLELPAGNGDDRPLWKVILTGPAAERTDEGLTLKIWGVRHTAPAGYLPDIEDHYRVRLALVAGLRELAAADPEFDDLVILGEHAPKAGGVNFEVVLGIGTQRLTYHIDDDELIQDDPLARRFSAIDVQRDWSPPAGNDPHMRRSIARGLRQFSAAEQRYQNLVIEGEYEPDPEGGNFLLQIISEEHKLYYQPPGGKSTPVEREWKAPDRSSIVPPIVAVILAILFRRPLIALFLGVLSGAYLLRRGEGEGLVSGISGGTVDVFRNFFWTEFKDPERYMIIGFVVFMLAMVGVMTVSGGIRGMMDSVARRANDVRKTQIATWLMGLVIFFDDYANTILVGATMRPLTDRFRISREKLAYIVDSTAAPVAGLSVFSTWIAFEVSTFANQLPAAGLTPGDGYAIFMRTIPYSFYCFLTLILVGLIALSGRDFGPMLSAERRARSTGQLIRKGGVPMVSERATTMEPAEGLRPAAWRALAPLATFIGMTLLAIAWLGGAFEMPASQLLSIEGATQVLGDGAGSKPLFIGSLLGFAVAVVAAMAAGLGLVILRAAWTTLRAMGVAFAILYLAWMIGAVCGALGTAPFLTALVGDALDARLLPTLLFLLAGVVAFATGSSWSTMSILLPLVVGLAYTLGLDTGLAGTEAESGQLLMVMSIGAVLSGSIFGDHCSPISDTTVMSSIASASDHIDHVRTQAPYAIVAMFVSIACGYAPAAYFGLSPWLGLIVGALVLFVVVMVLGRKSQGTEFVSGLDAS